MPRAEILVELPELDATLTRLAAEIGATFPAGVTLVGVLNGSIVFMADLVRRMRVPVQIDFLAISTLAAGTGRVRLLKDVGLDLDGRDVVVVEDIVDTGLSLAFLRRLLEQRGARSVSVCALLDRRSRRIVPVELEFVGFDAPDAFVIGYGLGSTSWYRNVPVIAIADPELLEREPGAYLAQFHPPAAPATREP